MASSSVAHNRLLAYRLDGDHIVRVEDEFLRSALVKVLIALGGILQRNDGRVNRLGDLHPVVEDRVHQLAMVAHNRALSGGEGEGLGPAQTNANTKLTYFGVLVDASWITRHVETRDTYATSSASDAHDRVQYRCWRFTRTSAVTACLKAHAVNGCIHLWLTDDLLDHVGQFAALCEIDGFTTEAARLLKSFFDHITDDDYGSAEQLCGGGTSQTYWTGASNVHCRARCHARCEGTVIPGWEDVREHGQVSDLRHGLVLVGKL